ncbi:MAG: hypothetical protein ACI3Z9_05030 [Candidatus Onthomorpha sp.]
MDIGIASIIVSLVFGLCGIVISFICCYKPKEKQLRMTALEKELLEAYQNIRQLLEIEKELTDECDKGKITVRRPYNITTICQPKHVEKRISELTQKLK